MLPPVEEAVLQSNPKFAILHSTLSKTILDSSGATRIHAAQKDRDVVSESLKVARTRAARLYLLRSAVCGLDLAPPSTSSRSSSSSITPAQATQNALPNELVELILLLSSRLSKSNISKSSEALLESTEPWVLLPSYIPHISNLVSSHLHTQALALARIVSPTSNASFMHRQIPKLTPAIEELQREISRKKLELEENRTRLVSQTTTLLGLYSMAITFIIHILEQNKHGAIARNARTRAEYLGLSAQKEEVDSRILVAKGMKLLYTDEVTNALSNYMLNLRDAKERLKERKKDLERQLWGYGVGRDDRTKERTMKEIARVYTEMMRETEEVGRDLKRLQGR
ncbi:hypothetical protein PVAG01_06049 [Phlyctema vagabunda]|uniref:Uncharacterized protein n=1 Tax=Phlyctema vagabunda TaxID=108571 RepID=A0ABR4PEZ5_9HELO